MSRQDYLATRTFASLDGLRALSILAVIWHHSGGSVSQNVLSQRGFLGVDLFFLISGFLITTLLIRERRRTGAISLPGFYWRRALRIFPAYWLMLAFYVVLAYRKPNPALRHDLPFAVFYISNLVPMLSSLSITWSLSTEEQFYLVVPALQKYATQVFVWILPVLYLLAILPPFGLFPGLPDFFKQTTFGPILLGVMLAYLLDRHWEALSPLIGQRAAPWGALALVVIACCYPGENISGWPRLIIHWSLLLLLATCVVREDNSLRPLLTWAPLKRIGVVSYGMYLYHMLVLAVFVKVSPGPVLFVAVAAVTWVVAEVSYRLFESRFLAMKHRISGTVIPPEPARV